MLTYGTKAISPSEVKMSSLRLKYFDPEVNEGKLHMNLELVDKVKEQVLAQLIS